MPFLETLARKEEETLSLTLGDLENKNRSTSAWASSAAAATASPTRSTTLMPLRGSTKS